METKKTETKILKINNPLYIGELAPYIQSYYKKLKPVGVTYESLYTYFCNAVQYGHEGLEFQVAFIDEKPVGFCLWGIMALPHISKVHCDHIYVWAKDTTVTMALMKGFKEYGKKHRCLLYDAVANDKAIFRRAKQVFDKLGINIVENGRINFVGRIV